jgi:succinate-semialdehyde dehydrogenase/glutarate-semialdehyde dehydrogenase
VAIATINPATGKTEREFTPHTADEVEARIARAAAAFRALADTTFEQRAEWMRKTADLLEADEAELAALITTEMGKPIAASRAEVQKCARAMRFYADHAEEFLSDQPLPDASKVGASRAYSR